MRKLRFWDRVSALLVLAGALLFGIPCFHNETITLLSMLGGGMIVLGAILGLVKVRCPSCGAYCGERITPKRPYCPRCGCNMEEETEE